MSTKVILGKNIVRILTVGLLAAYPFVIVFGLKHFGINYLVPVIIILFTLRVFLPSNGLKAWRYLIRFVTVIAIFLSVAGWVLKEAQALLYYPVVMSSAMFVFFAYSLWKTPTIIERLARIQYPDLAPEGVAYTRNVTIAWCVFFVLNGMVALFTVLSENMSLWMYYNGLVSYILMGLLFLGEWILRQKVIRNME